MFIEFIIEFSFLNYAWMRTLGIRRWTWNGRPSLESKPKW